MVKFNLKTKSRLCEFSDEKSRFKNYSKDVFSLAIDLVTCVVLSELQFIIDNKAFENIKKKINTFCSNGQQFNSCRVSYQCLFYSQCVCISLPIICLLLLLFVVVMHIHLLNVSPNILDDVKCSKKASDFTTLYNSILYITYKL